MSIPFRSIDTQSGHNVRFLPVNTFTKIEEALVFAALKPISRLFNFCERHYRGLTSTRLRSSKMRIRFPRKSILLAVWVIFSVCPLTLAQSSSSWRRVETLPVGTLISVESIDSQTMCRFRVLEDDALVCLLTTPNHQETLRFAKTSIHKIRRVRVGASAAIGALVGAGVGAGVGAAVDSRGANSSPRFTAALGGAVAILGAIAGAVRGVFPGSVLYDNQAMSYKQLP